MNLLDISLAACVLVGMSVGQIMFKLAAQRGSVVGILSSEYFWIAGVLYGCVSLLWVLLLRELELSKAYSVMAMTYVLVPLGSVLFLGEKVGARYLIGIALIVAGIIVTGRA